MIQISTSGGKRNYVFPRSLLEVARALFPDAGDDDGAVFRLFRSLVSDDLATVEDVAIAYGHAAAVATARERLVQRRI